MSDLDLGDDLGISGDTGTSGKFDMTKINPQILRLLIVIGIYLLGHSLLNSVIMIITGVPNMNTESIFDPNIGKKLLKKIITDSVITFICGIASAITLGTIFKINFGIGILLWLFILNATAGIIIRNILFKSVYGYSFVIDRTIKEYKNQRDKFMKNNSTKKPKSVNKSLKPENIDFIDIFLASLGGFSHIGTGKIVIKLYKKIFLKTLKKYKLSKNEPGIVKMLNNLNDLEKKATNIFKLGDVMKDLAKKK